MRNLSTADKNDIYRRYKNGVSDDVLRALFGITNSDLREIITECKQIEREHIAYTKHIADINSKRTEVPMKKIVLTAAEIAWIRESIGLGLSTKASYAHVFGDPPRQGAPTLNTYKIMYREYKKSDPTKPINHKTKEKRAHTNYADILPYMKERIIEGVTAELLYEELKLRMDTMPTYGAYIQKYRQLRKELGVTQTKPKKTTTKPKKTTTKPKTKPQNTEIQSDWLQTQINNIQADINRLETELELRKKVKQALVEVQKG